MIVRRAEILRETKSVSLRMTKQEGAAAGSPPVRSERVARGEANDEVDRSGRRYADEGAQCAPGAAPEGGHSSLEAEVGDCPHFERRGLRFELQGHRGRRPQGHPDLSEIR